MSEIKIFEGQIKFDSKNPQFTENGYLKVDGIVAKVGIVTRTDAQTGEIRNEYISEESLFSNPSINSFLPFLPVTQQHPTINGAGILLDEKTTGIFQRGLSIGKPEKITQSNEVYMKVPLVISDKKTIDDVLANKTAEISLGYVSHDIKQDGIFNGKKYNYIQVYRRNNHIALMTNGFNRSGADVRVKMDGLADQEFFNYKKEQPKEEKKKKMADEAQPQKTVKFDGKSIVTNEVGEILLEEKFKADGKKISDLEAEKIDLVKKYDGVIAERDSLKEKITDLQVFKDKFENQEKTALMNQVKPILGNDFKFDGLSTVEIKKQALIKAKNLDLGSKSDEYINARFDTFIELEKYDSQNVNAAKQQVNLGNIYGSNNKPVAKKEENNNSTKSFFDDLAKGEGE